MFTYNKIHPLEPYIELKFAINDNQFNNLQNISKIIEILKNSIESLIDILNDIKDVIKY